jgi:hypothetical protein
MYNIVRACSLPLSQRVGWREGGAGSGGWGVGCGRREAFSESLFRLHCVIGFLKQAQHSYITSLLCLSVLPSAARVYLCGVSSLSVSSKHLRVNDN